MLLLLTLEQVSMVIANFAETVKRTCLPPRLLEKPGGSGMLDAALDGRGIGEFNATTHSGGGGGGRADDIMAEMKERIGGLRGRSVG